jgi:hypothetical protein
MASDAVTEVHAPGQTRCNAVGAINQSGQETSDSANRDPQYQRQYE